jgi:hypothetical protein
VIADRSYLQVFCGKNPRNEPVGLWRYAGAGSEKEYIDFGVLENILLRGVIWCSSLAAMSVEILNGSQGFGALTPSLYQSNAGEIISTIAVEGFH